MNIDASTIDSPLALIALFVAIIELFLLYPLAKLDGKDRSRLVLFVIGYPIFIASAFFVFLWIKPVNLYTPQTLTPELQKALLPQNLLVELAPDRATIAIVERKVESLEKSLQSISAELDGRDKELILMAREDLATLGDIQELRDELLTRAANTGDLSREGLASQADILEREVRAERAKRVVIAQAKVEQFRDWMIEKGLDPAPPAPKVLPGGPDNLRPFLRRSGEIGIGAEDTDFLLPGLYIRTRADEAGFKRDWDTYTRQLVWTIMYFMGAQFSGVEWSTPNKIFRLGLCAAYKRSACCNQRKWIQRKLSGVLLFLPKSRKIRWPEGS